MKSLIGLLLSIFTVPALAVPGYVAPMTKDDTELLRQFITGEHIEVTAEQNARIYAAVKFEAAAQPQNLIELGQNAKKIEEHVKEKGVDDDSVLKAMAILKALEANQVNFNTAPHTPEETAALANIEALHKTFNQQVRRSDW